MASPLEFTIILHTEMADIIQNAISNGDYASENEIINVALHDWTLKRASYIQDLENLKTDLNKGLNDITDGRVKDFNTNSIIERGRGLFSNSHSA
jgi:antitoxin ParD1/3/4